MNDKFGEIKVSVAIYGGIQPSQNVISFLKLPARMRIFGRLDRVTGQKKTEEFAAGQHWEIRTNIENDRTGMTPDEIRKEKDKEYLERKACKKDCINLAKLRATDIPNCKDIMMPNPAPLKDEIDIQSYMDSYFETL